MHQDVWIKLENNAYRNPEALPQAPRKPLLSRMATPAEVRGFADRLEAYDQAKKQHREMQAAYYSRSVALESEFRIDLEAHFLMTGHPKADLLYGKAWQMGHAGGLHEVAACYADLVELVV